MEDLLGAGKLAKAIEEGTKEVRQLMYDFLAPSLKEAGNTIADRVRYYRFTSSISTVKKARSKLEAAGFMPGQVDLKTLVPLIEFSSLEEDENMIDKWAGLLASASAGAKSITSHVHILAELSPVDALVLDTISRMAQPAMVIDDVQYYGVTTLSVQEDTRLATGLFQSTLGNLTRLGLIQRVFEEPAFMFGNPPLGTAAKDMAGLAPLGYSFLRACKGPEPRQ